MQTTQTNKEVSIPLGLGILFMPYIFSWVLVSKGYSSRSRAIGFGWMIFIIVVAISSSKSPAVSHQQPTEIRGNQSLKNDLSENEVIPANSPLNDKGHRARLCNQIVHSIDTLLYEDSNHGGTATCLMTPSYVLIKPLSVLNDNRYLRFQFLSYSAIGFYANDDYAVPNNIYLSNDGASCFKTKRQYAQDLQNGVKYENKSSTSEMIKMQQLGTKITCPK